MATATSKKLPGIVFSINSDVEASNRDHFVRSTASKEALEARRQLSMMRDYSIVDSFGKFSASSQRSNRRVQDAYLDSLTGWAASTHDVTPWLRIDFGKPRIIRGLQTKSSADGHWVKKYTIKSSDDGENWIEDYTKGYGSGPSGVNSMSTVAVSYPLHGYSRSASTTEQSNYPRYAPEGAKIYGDQTDTYGWAAAVADTNQWYELDAGFSRETSGLSVYQLQQHNWWTQTFTVMYSDDKATWHDAYGGSFWDKNALCGNCDAFAGGKGYTYPNGDTTSNEESTSWQYAVKGKLMSTTAQRSGQSSQIDVVSFEKPITARYIRVYPQAYSGRPAGQFDYAHIFQASSNRESSFSYKAMSASYDSNQGWLAHSNNKANFPSVPTDEPGGSSWLVMDLGKARTIPGLRVRAVSNNEYMRTFKVKYNNEGTCRAHVPAHRRWSGSYTHDGNAYAYNSLLHSGDVWCGNGNNDWLALDLGTTTTIYGVATTSQSRQVNGWWVHQYTVDYWSNATDSWTGVTYPAQDKYGNNLNSQYFKNDYRYISNNYFASPVVGSAVRINVDGYHTRAFLQADVLLCEPTWNDVDSGAEFDITGVSNTVYKDLPFATPPTGRYIMIVNTDNSNNPGLRLDVLGSFAGTALTKASENVTADVINPAGLGSPCALTNGGETNPWWYTDLGIEKLVKDVSILYGNNEDIIRVYVGNTKPTGANPSGAILCKELTITNNERKHITCDAGARGRYLSIQVQHPSGESDPLELCDVKIGGTAIYDTNIVGNNVLADSKFETPITARFLHFDLLDKSSGYGWRVQPFEGRTYSTMGGEDWRHGSLSAGRGWYSDSSDVTVDQSTGPWYEIDYGTERAIHGIITRGASSYYTKTYRVKAGRVNATLRSEVAKSSFATSPTDRTTMSSFAASALRGYSRSASTTEQSNYPRYDPAGGKIYGDQTDTYGWAAAVADTNQWYELDAGFSRETSGLSVYQLQQHNWWTQTFTVMYSDDKATWHDAYGGSFWDKNALCGNCDAFAGGKGYTYPNGDTTSNEESTSWQYAVKGKLMSTTAQRSGQSSQIDVVSFEKPITARYIRVYPQAYSGRPAGQFDYAHIFQASSNRESSFSYKAMSASYDSNQGWLAHSNNKANFPSVPTDEPGGSSWLVMDLGKARTIPGLRVRAVSNNEYMRTFKVKYNNEGTCRAHVPAHRRWSGSYTHDGNAYAYNSLLHSGDVWCGNGNNDWLALDLGTTTTIYGVATTSQSRQVNGWWVHQYTVDYWSNATDSWTGVTYPAQDKYGNNLNSQYFKNDYRYISNNYFASPVADVLLCEPTWNDVDSGAEFDITGVSNTESKTVSFATPPTGRYIMIVNTDNSNNPGLRVEPISPHPQIAADSTELMHVAEASKASGIVQQIWIGCRLTHLVRKEARTSLYLGNLIG
eukprot:g2165.t1